MNLVGAIELLSTSAPTTFFASMYMEIEKVFFIVIPAKAGMTNRKQKNSPEAVFYDHS